MASIGEIAEVVLVGVGATTMMDVWSLILKRWGFPMPNYALVGRWAGHLCQGKLAHTSIAKAALIQGELLLGWIIDYVVGITFAFLLIAVQGTVWLNNSKGLPALLIGIGTVVFPFFVMQPAMGAGFVASCTPTPLKNCLRNLGTHAIFGWGLYLSAALLKQI